VHLDNLPKKRIEESQDAQQELACDAKARFLMNCLEDLLGELAGSEPNALA
jgi:hypothetical protein